MDVQVVTVAVDNDGYETPECETGVTGLRFWEITKQANSVRLGIEWPQEMSFVDDRLVFFGSDRVDFGTFSEIAEIDVSGAYSNIVVEIVFTTLPYTTTNRTAFFALGTLDDRDADEVTDAHEIYVTGTDPDSPDTDGDGIPDGVEVSLGMNPKSSDSDGDGLTNAEECDLGTNPGNRDSDGDGVEDVTEFNQSSDPADASDRGKANSRVKVPFYFGDHSESHSEKYALKITLVANSGTGSLPRSLSYVNANYGQCETKTAILMPGWKYELRLEHAGTDPQKSLDYDYTLNCTPPLRAVVSDPNGLFCICTHANTRCDNK